MSHIITRFVLIVSALYVCEIFSYDFCAIEKEYCKSKNKNNHILCHPEIMKSLIAIPGHEYTRNYTRLVMTKKIKKLIVDTHNKLRNLLACGKVKNKWGETFPPAAYMRELVWNDELEYLAGGHAEQCVMAHDQCRKTLRFKKPGQNLACAKTNAPYKDISVLDKVENFTTRWYLEFIKTRVTNVYEGYKSVKKTGHFTLLGNDRLSHVGCAYTRCWYKQTEPGEQPPALYLFSCDYTYANIKRYRMYRNASTPASKCAAINSTRSKKYKCLCANNDFENFDP